MATTIVTKIVLLLTVVTFASPAPTATETVADFKPTTITVTTGSAGALQ